MSSSLTSLSPARVRTAVIACAVLLAVLALAPTMARASVRDYSIIARDIVPSGQYGSEPAPPQAAQQAQMYNALTPLFNHVTGKDLLADFKPDKLGSAAVGPFTTETVPHAGVTIRRDPFDVPAGHRQDA